MKIINLKHLNMKSRKINITVDKNVKMIFGVTLIVFIILILLPIIFLDVEKGGINVFNLSDENITKSSVITFPINGKVKLYHKQEDTVEELDLEDYIMGVVASEVPANFNEEALKAQAVAARTFYMSKRNNRCKDAKSRNAEICDTTNCQVYMSKADRFSKWSKNEAKSNWSKIEKAVLDTKGQVLTYENSVLEYPQFFSVSSGKTEDAKDVFSVDVPYLKTEESKGEENAPKYKTTSEVTMSEFISKINSQYQNANLKKANLSSAVKVKSYTEGGSVKEIKIGNQTIKGTEFRTLFNLNSTNFKLEFGDKTVKINCTGYGHGVGMSQWGANVMAQNGVKYNEILKHYYKGVEIQEIKYTP